MKQVLRRVVGMFVMLSIVTGLIYPLVVLGIGQAFFARQANGSLVERGDQAIGSALLGQPFGTERYFHGRPSATGPVPFNGGASSGSNLGPLNPALTDAVAARMAALGAANPASTAPVPVDLVTASGSGLDPHVTPAAAAWQTTRIAAARGLPIELVQTLVRQHTESRTFGVLGEPRVNVLELNLALDAMR